MRPLSLSAYAAATTLAAPALRLMLRRRIARGKEIPDRLPERRGIDPSPRPPGPLIWLHAASVGETVSIVPVIRALLPHTRVLVTTGTLTSARVLAERGLGELLIHRFVPLDVPGWAARFLDHWHPDAAAFVESELWPNLLEGCRRRGIPLALINARMSARSAAGWARAPGLARRVLGAFDRVQAQSAVDAARLRALGARAVEAPGNLKLAAPDLDCDTAELARLRARIGDRPVWLAASTHPGEEALAAAVHRRLAPAHPGLLTIIAPRHPERGAALAGDLGAPRRAAGQDPPAGGVWLADTLGELGLLYRLARIVFVGRSLAGQAGGQNPLEPARLGCAVAVGPQTGNFTDVVAGLEAAGALARVADETALADWVAALLADPAARAQAGQAGIRAAAGAAELPAQVAAMLLSLMRR